MEKTRILLTEGTVGELMNWLEGQDPNKRLSFETKSTLTGLENPLLVIDDEGIVIALDEY